MTNSGTHHRVPTTPTTGRRGTGADASDLAPLPDWLTTGALVLDTRTGRRGEVQDWPYPASATPTRAWLRPVGGGREWTPRIADLRPVEAGERP
ncbi:hypothetical protein [Streptomyces megasporus]|uniref:hypothetical protein n=1 Tax=Streptomyces megasporus TaxID=44060 RepID=UPI0004E24765|nr:hypothetical protein [Streptomyces megasporus]